MALHDDQLVGGDALLGDIPGLARPADADAFSLPDRIEGKTDVLADRLSILIDDRAGRLRQIAIQELPERPLADEADPGRVLLGVVRQPGFERYAPDFGLPQAADREQHARKLLLVQPMQEISLVLSLVLALQQPEGIFWKINSRIVPGGNRGRAQAQRVIQERLEL